jgi:membrane protease YdiL (CAAX protease family)
LLRDRHQKPSPDETVSKNARLYRNSIVPQWVLSACIIALWVFRGRPWAALLLGPSTLLRLGIAFGFLALILALLLQQRRALLTRAEWPELVRRSLRRAELLIPRTKGEHPVAILLALTAGTCEEFMFRGFVIWYFLTFWPGTRFGVIFAIVGSSILFGLGHIYLGVKNVPSTAIAGVLFAAIAFLGGSLLPVMVLHTALDLNSFDLGYRAQHKTGEPGTSSTVPAIL